MTNDKAVSIINDFDVNFEGHTAEEVADAMELAMEALEKQIPQQAEYVTDYTWAIGNKQPICPECERYISPIVFIPVEGVEAKKISYCEFCGQAIDWSEDDE